MIDANRLEIVGSIKPETEINVCNVVKDILTGTIGKAEADLFFNRPVLTGIQDALVPLQIFGINSAFKDLIYSYSGKENESMTTIIYALVDDVKYEDWLKLLVTEVVPIVKARDMINIILNPIRK